MTDEIRAVAIIRDKYGNPKFDDPLNVPEVVLNALTKADKAYLTQLQREIENGRNPRS